MYKVFFKDRILTFSEGEDPVDPEKGELRWQYSTPEALEELVDAFEGFIAITRLTIVHGESSAARSAFTRLFRRVDAGGGLVVNGRGEFLVIRRKGVWDLPKGKLEEGEEFEAAALREVEEETGLAGLRLLRPVVSTYHTYRETGERILKRTRWFLMQYRGKGETDLQSAEGITDSVWVSPGETGFIRENTYPSILDVLRVMGYA